MRNLDAPDFLISRGKLPRTGVYEIRVGTIESENAEFKMRIAVR